MVETKDYYTKPEHGWTCFHCGQTFTKFGSARDHFGPTPASKPACLIKAGDELGLVMELRKAEAKIIELQNQLQNKELSK
jgi:hypothetical protein